MHGPGRCGGGALEVDRQGPVTLLLLTWPRLRRAPAASRRLSGLLPTTGAAAATAFIPPCSLSYSTGDVVAASGNWSATRADSSLRARSGRLCTRPRKRG